MKFVKIFFVSLIFGVFMTVGALLFVLERPAYSEEEKRELAKLPPFSISSLLDGSYTVGLQDFYNDTIPNRAQLKLFADRIMSYKGYAEDEIYIYIPDTFPDYTEEESQPTVPDVTPDSQITMNPTDSTETNMPTASPAPSGTTASTPTPTPNQNIGEYYQNQGIVVYKNRAMELYGGSKTNMQTYAAALNQLHANLPELTIWSMSIPIASAYYLPSQLSGKSADQKADCEYIGSLLSKGIHNLNVYDVLYAHVNEDIYLRTDHHWSYLGVYYAVKNMMEQSGVYVPDLQKDYTKKSVDGCLGSFYQYYGCTPLANYPETFVWYEPKFSFNATYYSYSTMNVVSTSANKMFFYSGKPFYDMVNHGDSYLTHIQTTNTSGRKIAVFKDSFGNALAPFLAAGFDEIWVIDLRYFEGDAYAFLEEHGITDVLMASCLFTNAGNKVSNYTRLFNS